MEELNYSQELKKIGMSINNVYTIAVGLGLSVSEIGISKQVKSNFVQLNNYPGSQRTQMKMVVDEIIENRKVLLETLKNKLTI